MSMVPSPITDISNLQGTLMVNPLKRQSGRMSMSKVTLVWQRIVILPGSVNWTHSMAGRVLLIFLALTSQNTLVLLSGSIDVAKAQIHPKVHGYRVIAIISILKCLPWYLATTQHLYPPPPSISQVIDMWSIFYIRGSTIINQDIQIVYLSHQICKCSHPPVEFAMIVILWGPGLLSYREKSMITGNLPLRKVTAIK